MQTTTLLIIGLVVVAALVIGYFVFRRQSSARLKSNFGPEYDRVVDEVGAKSKAEAELHEREKRVKTFELKPLAPTDRERLRALAELAARDRDGADALARANAWERRLERALKAFDRPTKLTHPLVFTAA